MNLKEQGSIQVDSLSKVFETNRGRLEIEALSNVNFSVSRGKFFSLLGPSGCGKSTLLRIIGGLVAPTGGSVSLGHGTSPLAAQRAKDIGFVFQDPGLLPWKTVAQNIQLPHQVNRSASRPMQRVEELLELVGLSSFSDAYPRQLSGGMLQRVSIARALSFSPSILLMDEPFGALDEITRESMRFELLRVWEQKRSTVLFVTHSIGEAIILSDEIAVLSSRPGRIRGQVDIQLPRPRNRKMERSPEFLEYVDQLTELLMVNGSNS